MRDQHYAYQFFMDWLLEQPADLSEPAFRQLSTRLSETRRGMMRRLSVLLNDAGGDGEQEPPIRLHLRGMIRVSDRLCTVMTASQAGSPEKRALMEQTQTGILELLAYVRAQGDHRLSDDLKVPDQLLLNNREACHRRHEAVNAFLREQAIPEPLITILDAFWEQLCAGKPVTYRQLDYYEKLQAEIPAWLSRHTGVPPEETLHRLLWYYNFNSKEYLLYLTGMITAIAEAAQDPRDGLTELNGFLLGRQQLPESGQWQYAAEQPLAVSRHVTDVVQKTAAGLKQLQEYAREPTAVRPVRFRFSQGQWCIWLDMAMEKSYFGEHANRTQVARHLAAVCYSGDGKPMKADTLRRSDMKHRDDDVITLHGLLTEQIQWLRDNYPHLVP